MSKKKSKLIALSGYCRENNLSIPSTLTVESIAMDHKIEAIPVSFKFKREDLDRVIPLYKLKVKSTRSISPPVMHIYEVKIQGNDSNFVLILNQKQGGRYAEEIVSILDDGIELNLIKILNMDVKNFISSIRELNLSMGTIDKWREVIGEMKVHYHFERNEGWFKTVLNRTIEFNKDLK